MSSATDARRRARGTGAPGRLAGPDPRGGCDPDRRPHRPDRSL